MNVYHVLKDGSRPKDINGHMVSITDAGSAYRVITNLNKKIHKKNASRLEIINTK